MSTAASSPTQDSQTGLIETEKADPQGGLVERDLDIARQIAVDPAARSSAHQLADRSSEVTGGLVGAQHRRIPRTTSRAAHRGREVAG